MVVSLLDYVDSKLVGRHECSSEGMNFPIFMAGCLREVSHSKDSPGLVLRKVSHLSYLSHLFIKYTNINRIHDEYCSILTELAFLKHIQDYDYETLFKMKEDQLIEDLVNDAIENDQNHQEFAIGRHQCEHCSKSFRTKSLLLKHAKFHSDLSEDSPSEKTFKVTNPVSPEVSCLIEEYVCYACDAAFDTEDDLRAHRRIHEEENHSLGDNVKDDIGVAENAADEPELDTGQNAGQDVSKKGVTCEECGLECRSKNALSKHIRTHQKLDCSICGLTFSTARKLAGHVRACAPKSGPEMCALCGKSYRNIKFHNYKVHSGRVVSCDLCDFTTSLNSRLTKHKLQVHEGRTETCHLCGKVVKELRHHKRRGCPFMERKERLNCDHCDKTFAQRDALNRHIRNVHFKIKDKSCDQCSYTTSEGFNLRMHKARVHEGRKVTLTCPLCNKRVNNLAWHTQQYHKHQDVSAFLEEEMDKNAPRSSMLDDPMRLLCSENGEEVDLSLATAQLIFPLPREL